jgi:ATP-dependent helicase/nuclease subunit B
LLAHAAQQAWQTTLCAPELDLLWRTQERGEAIQASPWVQVLMSPQASLPGLDPRPLRRLHPQATERPAASAPDTLPQRLSASAYQDLRDCPYRFFALRQLRLSDAPELQAEPDQRDMGNWLHAVLSAFHTARGDQRPGVQADRQALDRLAIDTAASMGLNAGEGGAGFLPYQAVWPGMREGYLSWLAEFENRAEQAGARFLEGEVAKTAQAGAYQLVGQLDRVDLHDSPHGPVLFVIDYKTESRSRTHERVKEPLEDTQLAFYAALLPEGELRAAYLSISDQRGDGPRDKACLLIEQPDVMRVREPLLQGIQHDMDRIQAGQPMTALGEGRVCDFCAARGLCRKDFWGPR